MRTVPRVLLIVGAAAAVPLAVWLFDVVRRDRKPPVAAKAGNANNPNNPTAAKPAPGGTNPPQNPRPLAGVAGCGAAACHGAPGTGTLSPDIWQSSFTVWNTTDPHAKAYRALTTPLARTIIEGMHGKTPATEEPRCLACHTNPTTIGDTSLRIEGMNCESCHGNPNKWSVEHTSFGTRERHKAYESVGMPKLFDLGTRAEVCAGCHVGAPADPLRGLPLRDMNHDMIAAGHPPLNFDFADAMHRLPKHWFEKDRTAADPRTPAGPAFEAKAWLVGRVAVAAASCSLTADRATRADPWPEFAEMNCFACHHEFEPKGWRLSAARRTPARKPGMAAWQTIWPVTRADDFVKLNSEASHDLTALIANMERTRYPDTTAAAKSATSAATKLGALRNEFSRMNAKDAAKLARGVFLAIPPERADILDWDEAKQVFFGLAALDRSRLKLVGTADPVLAKFEEHLRFPQTPDKSGFRSPRGYDPASGRDLFRECLKSVPARADVIER